MDKSRSTISARPPSATRRSRTRYDRSSRMLRGKTAIVTGSTSGIGLGIARALAQQGANILLNGFGDRREIDALIAGISEEHGVVAAYSPADMSIPAEVSALVAQCVHQFDGVDILVN